MRFLNSMSSSANAKTATIDRVIEHLGREGSALGTSYSEITYRDVMNYIQDTISPITTSIENPHNGWTEFDRSLDGQTYQVTVSRTPDGRGAILTSRMLYRSLGLNEELCLGGWQSECGGRWRDIADNDLDPDETGLNAVRQDDGRVFMQIISQRDGMSYELSQADVARLRAFLERTQRS